MRKKKKSDQFNRATKTVLKYMNEIFQKHRDTKPMGEDFFEEFKNSEDIGGIVRSIFGSQPKKTIQSGRVYKSERRGNKTNGSQSSLGKHQTRLTIKLNHRNLVQLSANLMGIAYKQHAESINTQEESTHD